MQFHSNVNLIIKGTFESFIYSLFEFIFLYDILKKFEKVYDKSL